jgi:hypothetical protein
MLRFIVLVLALGAAAHAHAVPWCYRGHIVEVGNYSLDGSQLTAFAAANGITDHYWAGSYAAHQVCQVHAGWTGPSLGVPGAGQVEGLPYAPSGLLSGNGYHMSQGVSFRCKKCFPLMVVKPVRELELRSE